MMNTSGRAKAAKRQGQGGWQQFVGQTSKSLFYAPHHHNHRRCCCCCSYSYCCWLPPACKSQLPHWLLSQLNTATAATSTLHRNKDIYIYIYIVYIHICALGIPFLPLSSIPKVGWLRNVTILWKYPAKFQIPNLIKWPRCGFQRKANRVEHIQKPLTIGIMGKW